ncbi:MAG: hypothetical protein IPK15_18455 [Verrucomicrobia bacterium]|nr:hypothetical protein [Verrucomicrobiota bacterium]
MSSSRIALVAALFVVNWLTASTSHAAVTNIIRVTGPTAFVFSPTNLLIETGDSVRWTNVSGTSHDVTPGVRVGNTTNAPNPAWAPASLGANNGTFQVAFSNVGVYPYLCGRHVFGIPSRPEQTGTVTVVQANLRPLITLNSPTNLTTLTAPANITLSATASDGDGTVSSVQFLSGTNLLGSVSSEPYELNVTLAAGWHQIIARAIDNLGGSNSTEIVNVLVNSNRTVVVSGLAFSPSVLTVTVGDTVTFTGLGSFHTVTGSGTNEAFCGNALSTVCVTTFNRVGSFPFHCNPHRSLGMTGLVNVVGPNLRPFGRLTSPVDGGVFAAPANINFSAEAFDLYGAVRQVRFVRGTSTSLGVISAPPYTLTVSNVAAGSYSYSAYITDDSNLISTSGPVNVTVVAPVDIQLLSPTNNAGTFTFDYTANPGLTYIIEGSAEDGSPTPFTSIATNIATNNVVTFVDPNPTGRTNRVYRVLRRQ